MWKNIWKAAKWVYENIEEIKDLIELLKHNPKAKSKFIAYLNSDDNNHNGSGNA